jgi:hypothetical protein
MLGFVVPLSLVTVAYAGGWDIVTLKDFPDFAGAGKPLNLTFTVWAPSLEPLANVQPSIRATFGTNAKGVVSKARVRAAGATGEYTATLILPEPGDWVITIDTEYPGASTLPPLKVISPGTAAPTRFSPADLGLRLFAVKGCNACHLHEGAGKIYGRI